uniref:Gag protein n=1 Tax=Acrobeloides nanus TaxID=290746 RepID=A0A914CV15_9BILA
MPDITKLIYLKRSCIGKAKNAIAQYPTASENYQICRKVLKNRFGDEKHVIMNLHVELQNLQVGSPKASDLRKFSEDVERICSLFELVGEDANHHRLLLLKKPTEEWDVETLRKYLQQYLSNREHVDAVQNFKSPSQEQPKQTSALVATRKQGQRQNQPQGKSNQNFRPSQQQQHGRKGKCPFCNESHGPSRCNVYGTSEVRKNRAVQRNLCLKCLSSKHDSSSCSNHFECRLCHSFEHHLSLCHLINSYQAERSHSQQNQNTVSSNPSSQANQNQKQGTVKIFNKNNKDFTNSSNQATKKDNKQKSSTSKEHGMVTMLEEDEEDSEVLLMCVETRAVASISQPIALR